MKLIKKTFWLAAIAGLGYLGYQEAPGLELERMVGIPTSSATEASARSLSAGCVDVNRADYQALQRIKYVNPVRAKTILEIRVNDPFRSLNGLTRIRGINRHRVQEIRSEGLACIR